MWALLKSGIAKRERKAGRRYRGREELIALAQDVWESLDWEMIHSKIIGSMGKRVAMVLKAKGGRSKY